MNNSRLLYKYGFVDPENEEKIMGELWIELNLSKDPLVHIKSDILGGSKI